MNFFDIYNLLWLNTPGLSGTKQKEFVICLRAAKLFQEAELLTRQRWGRERRAGFKATLVLQADQPQIQPKPLHPAGICCLCPQSSNCTRAAVGVS